MSEAEEHRVAQEIAEAGSKIGVPISDENARLAAKWGDLVTPASDAVRAIDYQDHEPANTFNPVVIDGGSSERNRR